MRDPLTPHCRHSAVTELVCDVTFVGTLSRTQSRLQRRVFAAVLRQSITELRADGAGEGHRAGRGHGDKGQGWH